MSKTTFISGLGIKVHGATLCQDGAGQRRRLALESEHLGKKHGAGRLRRLSGSEVRVAKESKRG